MKLFDLFSSRREKTTGERAAPAESDPTAKPGTGAPRRAATQSRAPTAEPASPRATETPPNEPARSYPPNPTASAAASVAAAEPATGSAAVSDDLEATLGNVFDAAKTPDQQGGEMAHEHDVQATRELFLDIAATQSQPVKDFVFELKRGTARKDWLEICRPVMRTLIEAAESMALQDEAKRMSDFDEALALAGAEDGNTLAGEARELILSCYEGLSGMLGEEHERRESVIIHSLLRQIPDVGHVTFEKLYGAGLTSLESLFLASPEDLSSTTGIPDWLCQRICAKLQEHRERLESKAPEAAQTERRRRLVEMINALRRHHEAFEQAADMSWADPERSHDKREARSKRQACALQINVLLAEMDELDLVEQLEKLGFERRIESLSEYLGIESGAFPDARQTADADPMPNPAQAER